ncbi:MAG: ABC transporter permease [Puniceicoccales bacterium]|jgi:lipoprotein-releasing system permease protein|nr:ABC transporter permease [Puniceicoccales bacterium]
MNWCLYLALKQLFPTGKKFSFFSAMSIIGVALGVTVLFVVQSVMNGFQHEIRRTIVATQGEVRIDANNNILYNADNLGNFLKNRPEVTALARYSYGVGMLEYNSRSIFPLIKGIDLENEVKVVELKKFIKEGSLQNFDNRSIILSSELANQIGATVGNSVEIYSPIMLKALQTNEIILPKTLKIVATYETGYRQADENIAIVMLDTMQDLYSLGEGVHGISLKLKPNVRPEKFAFELNRNLTHPVHAASWQEINKDLLFVLKTEKTMMFFILVFILLVAAFSITSSMTISVVRKTREIGLINALGGTIRQCGVCFMIQGLIIGIAGSVIGVIAGALILKFRNDIISVFVKLCGVEDFMLKFYSFANMPATYQLSDILTLVTFAVAICCLAGMLPARKVAKIKPADALRNE